MCGSFVLLGGGWGWARLDRAGLGRAGLAGMHRAAIGNRCLPRAVAGSKQRRGRLGCLLPLVPPHQGSAPFSLPTNPSPACTCSDPCKPGQKLSPVVRYEGTFPMAQPGAPLLFPASPINAYREKGFYLEGRRTLCLSLQGCFALQQQCCCALKQACHVGR